MKEFFQCLEHILKTPKDKMKHLFKELTSSSRFPNPGRFPPPPAVKASLSVTKEPARSKSAKTSRTLVFILDEGYGGFALFFCVELSYQVLLRDGQAKL